MTTSNTEAKVTKPTETVDPVVAAELEASEAEALIAALEERVRNGDLDISPDQLQAQEQVARFAKLRAEAAHRKAADARETARLAAIAKLDTERIALTKGEGDKLVGLLMATVDNITEFKAAIDRHNEAMRAWYDARSSLDPTTQPERQLDAKRYLGHTLGYAQRRTGIEITADMQSTDGILDDLSPSKTYAPPRPPMYYYADATGVTYEHTYSLHAQTLRQQGLTDVTDKVRAQMAETEDAK